MVLTPWLMRRNGRRCARGYQCTAYASWHAMRRLTLQGV
jgi:hypothetical protein